MILSKDDSKGAGYENEEAFAACHSLCWNVCFVLWRGWFWGYFKSYKNFYGSVYDESFPAFEELEIPEHDPNKPTVAVMLGDGTTTTEIFDFLIPYELFAMKESL